jgi:hypothetical protein
VTVPVKPVVRNVPWLLALPGIVDPAHGCYPGGATGAV